MNQDIYNTHKAALQQSAAQIETSKRPGYTQGNVDVLANFKGVAAKTGLTPEQTWCVYFLKHIDAIVSIMTKPGLPVSEAPIGRFSDAINYLYLGWGLLQERGESASARELGPGKILGAAAGALPPIPAKPFRSLYQEKIERAQERQEALRDAERRQEEKRLADLMTQFFREL